MSHSIYIELTRVKSLRSEKIYFGGFGEQRAKLYSKECALKEIVRR